MNIIWIIVGSLLVVFILALIIISIYIIFLLRKTNIIAQKIDYLIEDITYKAEALTPTVDVVNKFSNYAIAADATANKSAIDFLKILRNNQSSILKLTQNILSSFNSIWDKQTSKDASKKMEDSIIVDDEPIFKKNSTKETRNCNEDIPEDDYTNESEKSTSNKKEASFKKRSSLKKEKPLSKNSMSKTSKTISKSKESLIENSGKIPNDKEIK